MLKHGGEFFEWLQSGASVYVCGAKEPMSVDVENTILKIISQHGHKNEQEASAYLAALKEAGEICEGRLLELWVMSAEL